MSTRRQILEDGFTAGMIGFATTVVVFGVANVLAGQSPIHTAALLGGALFWGDASRAVGGVGSALAYSVVHLAVFVIFGIGAAALHRRAAPAPGRSRRKPAIRRSRGARPPWPGSRNRAGRTALTERHAAGT